MANSTNNRIYCSGSGPVSQPTNWSNNSVRPQYGVPIVAPQVPGQAIPAGAVAQQTFLIPVGSPYCTYVPQHPSMMQQLAFPPMIPYENCYVPQEPYIPIPSNYIHSYGFYQPPQPAQEKRRMYSIPIVDPNTLQVQNEKYLEKQAMSTKPKSPEKPYQEPKQQYQILRKETNQGNNNSYQQFSRGNHRFNGRQNNRGHYYKNFQNYNKSPSAYNSPAKSTLEVVPEVEVFEEKPKAENKIKMNDESTTMPDIDGLSDISSTTLNVSSIEFEASFKSTKNEVSKESINNTDKSIDNSSIASGIGTAAKSAEASTQSRSVHVTANLKVTLIKDQAMSSVTKKILDQPVAAQDPIEEVTSKTEALDVKVDKEATEKPSEDAPVMETLDEPQQKDTFVPEVIITEKETTPKTEKMDQSKKTEKLEQSQKTEKLEPSKKSEAPPQTMKSEKYVETSTSVHYGRHYQNNSGSNYSYTNRNYSTKKFTNYGDKYNNQHPQQYNQQFHVHQQCNNYNRSNYQNNGNYNKQNNGRKSMDKNNYGSHYNNNYNNNYDHPPMKSYNRQYKSSNLNVQRNVHTWESSNRQPAKPTATPMAVPATQTVPIKKATVTRDDTKTPKIPKIVEKQVQRYDFEAIYAIIDSTREWDVPDFIEKEKYQCIMIETVPNMIEDPMFLMNMINSRFTKSRDQRLEDYEKYCSSQQGNYECNSWHNCQTNEKPVFAWMPQVKNDFAGEMATLKRKFMSILNKLSEENFKELLDEIRGLRINHNEKLKLCITMIVQKASNERSFSSIYAELCLRISKFQKSFENSLKSEISASFDKEQGEIMEKIKELQEKIHYEANVDTKEELKCEECLMRHKILGTIRFMGELFLVNVLTSQEICNYMEMLVKGKTISQESVECLCRLLMRIGSKIAQTDTRLLEKFFTKLDKIMNGKMPGPKVSSRHVFLIRDLKDLRDNNWRSVVMKHAGVPLKMISIKTNRKQNENHKNEFEIHLANFNNRQLPSKVMEPVLAPAMSINPPMIKKGITTATATAKNEKPWVDLMPKFKATTSEIVVNADATTSSGNPIKILKRGDEPKMPELVRNVKNSKEDDEKTVKKLWMAFSEYLTNEIYDELLLEIKEVKTWNPEIIQNIIVKCIEYGKKETTVCETFLKFVLTNKMITSQLFLEAIKILMEFIDDLALDILNIYDVVADLMLTLMKMELLAGDEVLATVEANEKLKSKLVQQEQLEPTDVNNNTIISDAMGGTSDPPDFEVAPVCRIHTADSGISVEEKPEEAPLIPLNQLSTFELFMNELRKEKSNFQEAFNPIRNDLQKNAVQNKAVIMNVMKDVADAMMDGNSEKLMNFLEYAFVEMLEIHVIGMIDVYEMLKAKMKCDFEKKLLLRLLKIIHGKLDTFDQLKTLPSEPFVQKDFKFQKLMKQSGWKLDKKKKHH